MYTLREAVAADYVGTLRALAELGYRAVELVTLGDMTAAQLRRELDTLGLAVSGMHIGLDKFESNADLWLENLAVLGGKYPVVPYLAPERRTSGDDYRRLGQQLNEYGRKAKEHGMQLCYHNHDFEFVRYGDATGLALLFEEADPALVKSELDVYWAAKAGVDPQTLMRGMSGSVPLVHVKDMADTPEQEFAEVGSGTLDFPAIFQTGDEIGVDFYVVEQDVCKRPPLESVGISLNYLRSIGRA